MSNLPAGWVIARLGDLVDCIEAGKNIRCTERPPLDGERGIVKVSAVTSGLFRQEESKTVAGSARLDEKARIKAGDLLIARANGTLELVGVTVRVASISKALYLSDKILRLKADAHLLPWIHRALMSPTIRREIAKKASGNTVSVRNISQAALKSLKIPVAPMAERKRIVGKLENVLPRIEQCRARLGRVPHIISRLREAILEAAVSGKLTKEWRTQNGSDICEWQPTHLEQVLTGSANGLSKRTGKDGAQTTVLRLADFRGTLRRFGGERKILLDAKELEKYQLRRTDILVVRVNGSRDIAGRFILYLPTGEQREAYCDHFIRLRLDTDLIAPAFAQFIANSGAGRRYIEAALVTSAGQNTINQTALFGLPIRLPPIAEQQEAIRSVQQLLLHFDGLHRRYVEACAQVEKLTPSVLAKAFCGELVPQDPNDEPAGEMLEGIRKGISATVAVGSWGKAVGGRAVRGVGKGGGRSRASSE